MTYRVMFFVISWIEIGIYDIENVIKNILWIIATGLREH